MKYVLMEYADKNNFTASSKARNDAAEILQKNGAVYIPLFRAKSGHSTIALSIIKNCFAMAARLKKRDIVFIQYPYNPQIVNIILIYLLSFLAKTRRSKICILIHDINSFRFTDEKEKKKKLDLEASLLSRADHVIAHNNKMISLLKNHGCKTQLHNLHYFDYLYDGELPEVECRPEVKIVIAGNLAVEKSGYIYDIPESDISYNLYGINYQPERNNKFNVTYKGAFPPNDLISHLDGSFGLVWDGCSIETCEGNFGTYLRYNDPHKFSLYLAAGLPVIVWRESALASLVEKEKIGFAINSISEISEITKDISLQEYENMKRNVNILRTEVCSGKRLLQAINEIG